MSRKRGGQPDDFCVSAVHGPTTTNDAVQINNLTVSPPPGSLRTGDFFAGPTAEEFKSALGQFLTGLTVVATRDGAGPIGMTCQAFTAVSLSPPLVLFCARTQSETARAIAGTGTFSVSMLGKSQRTIAERFGSSASHDDRFNDVDWTPGATTGCPLLNGAIAHLECILRASHPAGDHRIHIGEVVAASAYTDNPLTYFRGRYK
ncbi:flavin reductase family protein [Nocardia sp. CS682]|uniref:flavin reductase family protein n=1 Tax=Nocardia sp. CS682 TaxID=1047172 RepID=UPI001431A48F|nr:flavin reductase family protein [Nocardia sp. CS682]